MTNCINNGKFNFDYLGNEDDLKNEIIFKNFDINYIPLNNLPSTYYPIKNIDYNKFKKEISITSGSSVRTENNENVILEFKKNLNILEDKSKIYNNYNIYSITLIICLIWILVLIFALRYLHLYYNIYYIYVIVTIIILLLIFSSLWFLYVNNDLV
jgi:hypothetical protein